MDEASQAGESIPEGVRLNFFYRRRRLRYLVVACVLVALIQIFHRLGLLGFFLTGTFPSSRTGVWMIPICMLTIFQLAMMVWVFRRRMPRIEVVHQWRELRRARPTECVWCGYNTAGCPGSVCSECGKLIDPPDESKSCDSVQTQATY